jgi:uncharacterized protein involved in exopolysaccharide biosynthesis
MRSLKTAEALVHAAQIGTLLESTIKAAADSRQAGRQAAAAWWAGKIGQLRNKLKQAER